MNEEKILEIIKLIEERLDLIEGRIRDLEENQPYDYHKKYR